MELRTLKYFLMVAREESISSAANALHITQPTLSRQMKELEDELGTKLFERGNRSNRLSLTEKGMLLRRRAEEIIDLSDKTALELSEQEELGGTITIGAAETHAMKEVIRIISDFKKEYPAIKFSFYSGDGYTIQDQLEKGLVDFGVFIDPFDLTKYESIVLNSKDRWGILVKDNHPLAKKESITLEELKHVPMYISKQIDNQRNTNDFNIQGSYNLINNAVYLAEEDLGVVLCLDKLVHTCCNNLSFIPLSPETYASIRLCWKKYHAQSRSSELFLDYLRNALKYYNNL
ncbi:MAG: LysR family transcriptional regulator [Erysipelotrichaceae bacterium]|nr:LysR family transcriptional regulator [Erysipelotrichaceae bacterium]